MTKVHSKDDFAEGNRPSAGAAIAGVMFSAATGVFGLHLGGVDGLAAMPVGGTQGDADADGIGDLAEVIWGTDPLLADSDGDGLSDLEELALGSDPLIDQGPIDTTQVSVGLASFAAEGLITSRIAVYVPDGDLSSVDLTVGAIFKITKDTEPVFVPLTIPIDFFVANGSLDVMDAPSNTADRVILMDLPLPQSYVEAVGWMPVFAAVGPVGAGFTSAAAHNLVFDAGVPFVIEEPLESTLQVGVGGVVYRPLIPGESMPPTSSLNEICYQDIVAVGVTDGVGQFQVQEAECLPANSHCSSSCAGSVGGPLDLFDPLSLLGG